MSSESDKLVRDGVVEVYAAEAIACWGRFPNKLLFSVLLAVWVLLFQFLGNSTFGYIKTASLFTWMWPQNAAANSEFDSGPGILLPFVIAGLFWWKRRELLGQPLATWNWGMSIVAFSLVLHLTGYLIQQPRVSIVALFLGIYGIMGLAWGSRFLRHALFPYVLFVFAIPLGSLSIRVTQPLRMLVTVLVEFITKSLLGMDVVRVGTGLFDAQSHWQYDVAAACSGIRSLMAILFICTVYGYVVFRASWRWWLMIVIALPLAVFGNMLRLLAIVLTADLMGQNAGNWVHENWFFSLLPYVPAFAGVLLLSRWLDPKRKPLPAEEAKP